jgi:lipopolysaccharide biosynthesis protein
VTTVQPIMPTSRADYSPHDEEAGSDLPVALFVHVHYADVWADMAEMIAERLTLPFRLVLTSSLPERDLVGLVSPHLNETLFFATENRGRDIRPFLQAYAAVDGYEIGLKLHTKRSIHRLDGDEWRDWMLSSLLPDGGQTAALVSALARDPRIGMVSAEGSLLRIRPWIMRNTEGMEKVARILGLDLARPLATSRFAAGSMFWFRRSALEGLADPRLLPIFEPEAGQVDGTIAHAIERITAVLAERNGMLALPSNILPVFGADFASSDLESLIRSRPGRQNEHLKEPHKLVVLVMRYAPFLGSAYARLPKGARRALRFVLRGS